MTEDTTTPAPSEPVAGPVQRPVGRLEPEREELRATLEECEAAGEQAGRQGLPFGACPYTFDRAGVDQWTFDAHWRPRLDAWFAGWDRTRPPRPKAFHPRWHKTPNGNPREFIKVHRTWDVRAFLANATEELPEAADECGYCSI